MPRDPLDILAAYPNYREWLAEAPTVEDWARKFYREYVGISDEEELNKHLMEIRTLAWEVYKYRCIASFLFVNYNLGESYGSEWYKGILERMKHGDLFLDLACAFGQIARNLAYDGAPHENIISGDLQQRFWDLGYQLYRDREKFHGVFHQGDIFDENYLNQYNGKINILHTSAFFHLFDLPAQKQVVRQMMNLVSTKPGTIIFGRQAANTIPHRLEHPLRPGQILYLHNEESFRAMFQEVVGQGWDMKTWVRIREDDVSDNGGKRGRLMFIATRL
jgi:SAM-dependent methyltransferase